MNSMMVYQPLSGMGHYPTLIQAFLAYLTPLESTVYQKAVLLNREQIF